MLPSPLAFIVTARSSPPLPDSPVFCSLGVSKIEKTACVYMCVFADGTSHSAVRPLFDMNKVVVPFERAGMRRFYQ